MPYPLPVRPPLRGRATTASGRLAVTVPDSEVGVGDEVDGPVDVHPSAIVHPTAVLEPGVTVGPWAMIEANARIGRDSVIGPRAYVGPNTTIGARNQLYIGAIIGQDPQVKGWRGATTFCETGPDCVFRENAVVHRGAEDGAGTVIGARVYLMHQAHVGHDGVVGDDVVLGPNCLLAGHVIIDEGANISAHTAVHQHCRVGRLAFLRGKGAISMDLPPFCLADRENSLRGINVVGLRRAGMSREERDLIKLAFTRLFRSRRPMSAACDDLEAEFVNGRPMPAPVRELVDFVRSAKRGVVRFRDDESPTNGE